MDLIIDFKYWTGHQKLFEATVVDGGEEVDRRPGLMKVVFYDVPKMYNTYTFLPRQGSINDRGEQANSPLSNCSPDNCTTDNCHLGQLSPGQFPQDDSHLGQLPADICPPSDNWPPDNSHLGKLPPDNWTWTISSYNKLTPGQITIEHLPPTTILIKVIASRRLRCLKIFYCLLFHLCHSKILYKHKHAFFQNIRQISPLE